MLLCYARGSATSRKSAKSLSSLSNVFTEATASMSEFHLRLIRFQHLLENNKQHIVYLIAFYSVCLFVFTERFYCKLYY